MALHKTYKLGSFILYDQNQADIFDPAEDYFCEDGNITCGPQTREASLAEFRNYLRDNGYHGLALAFEDQNCQIQPYAAMKYFQNVEFFKNAINTPSLPDPILKELLLPVEVSFKQIKNYTAHICQNRNSNLDIRADNLRLQEKVMGWKAKIAAGRSRPQTGGLPSPDESKRAIDLLASYAKDFADLSRFATWHHLPELRASLAEGIPVKLARIETALNKVAPRSEQEAGALALALEWVKLEIQFLEIVQPPSGPSPFEKKLRDCRKAMALKYPAHETRRKADRSFTNVKERHDLTHALNLIEEFIRHEIHASFFPAEFTKNRTDILLLLDSCRLQAQKADLKPEQKRNLGEIFTLFDDYLKKLTGEGLLPWDYRYAALEASMSEFGKSKAPISPR